MRVMALNSRIIDLGALLAAAPGQLLEHGAEGAATAPA